MKRYLVLIIALLLVSVPCVMAPATGGLRISPQWPIMVGSPATFPVWAQSADSYDVNVLLVTTQECFDDLGSVVVSYDTFMATLDQGDFTGVTGMGGVYVPTSGATTGARYTVASLKDHLDYGLSEALESDDTIYWALVPITHDDFDPLTTVPVNLTVELDCDDPRMLVYLLGKSTDNADLFDMRVPPTNPGFLVPEIVAGSLMAVTSMVAALGLFFYKKRQQQ